MKERENLKNMYDIYSDKYKKLKKENTNNELFMKLPDKKYDIIYAGPPWDYGGKMQYDKTCIKSENGDLKKDIFISSAEFHYPTVKLKDLKKLDIKSIAKDNCLLFMWTTGPQMENSIILGKSWGFEYKTVGFVWDKEIHNPGHYTLSETEFCLIFKKGKIPLPRGERNIRQIIKKKRGRHSEKPEEAFLRIEKMFPLQEKIELFSRKKRNGWDAWGIDLI